VTQILSLTGAARKRCVQQCWARLSHHRAHDVLNRCGSEIGFDTRSGHEVTFRYSAELEGWFQADSRSWLLSLSLSAGRVNPTVVFVGFMALLASVGVGRNAAHGSWIKGLSWVFVC
jgi:hypothetical protein